MKRQTLHNIKQGDTNFLFLNKRVAPRSNPTAQPNVLLREPNSAMITFYKNGGTTHKGLTLDVILQQTSTQIESDQDSIQWLFPTSQQNRWNIWAAVTTAKDRAYFRQCDICYKNWTINFSFS